MQQNGARKPVGGDEPVAQRHHHQLGVPDGTERPRRSLLQRPDAVPRAALHHRRLHLQDPRPQRPRLLPRPQQADGRAEQEAGAALHQHLQCEWSAQVNTINLKISSQQSSIGIV